MRDAALPGCTQRLANETTCRDHLVRFHEDCARLTRRHPGRYSGGAEVPDPSSYLDCVVLGVDDWVADNGRKTAAAAEQRRLDSSPR